MTNEALATVTPIRGTPLRRYFLDRNGVPTSRMANAAGKGHYDIAMTVLGKADGDLYAQMEKLGFVRVLETDMEIHAEGRKLTKLQKHYLKDRELVTGRVLHLNNQLFKESKDPRRLTPQSI